MSGEDANGLTYGRSEAGEAVVPSPSEAGKADEREAWIDRHGDIWTVGAGGLLHTPETRPFSREYIEKKWGPLERAAYPAYLTPLPPAGAAEIQTGWCDSCQLDGLYLTHDCARVQADVASIRLLTAERIAQAIEAGSPLDGCSCESCDTFRAAAHIAREVGA